MNNLPLISVIIPVYKVEEYLHECVDSILSQTYKNLEIILVDDGSPDNCGAICDTYALLDDRIRVIHKKNGGLSDARNAGLDVCMGDYISFVDSDDCILPTFIETLYKNLIRYDGDISVIGSFRNLAEFEGNDQRTRVSFYENYLDFLYDDTIKDWKIEVWRKLYKRNIWETLRFPKGKKSEDTFVFPYVVYQRKIVYANCRLYYYRINSNSIMALFDDSVARDANEAFEQNILFFKKNHPEYTKRVIRDQVHFNYTYYLKLKVYNSICKRYLINHVFLVLKLFPLKTCLRLYFVILGRSLVGKI